MKVQVPEALKSEVPQTTFGRVLAATPVVMAVIATMLAGLASSEMTKAQYDRALAAQQQSKAGDQWSFFQAKRLRGAFQRNSSDLLVSLTEIQAFNVEGLRTALGRADDTPPKTELLDFLGAPEARQALTFLQEGEAPKPGSGPALDPAIKAALESSDNLKRDEEMATVLTSVKPPLLEAALRAARDQAEAFDTTTQPINQAVDRLESLIGRALSGSKAGSGPASAVIRGFTHAKLRYNASRYETEARLNQAVAYLYELQVRLSNFSAERHHVRSQRFFFGMLAAQMGVIVSTLAMAGRQRNLLWTVAAVAGLVAVAFAVYVYLYV